MDYTQLTKEQLIESVQELKKTTTELQHELEIQKANASDSALKLHERVKELAFHKKLASILSEPHDGWKAIIKNLCEIIPESFQYADKACCEIELFDEFFCNCKTPKASDSEKIKETIFIQGVEIGTVQVFYAGCEAEKSCGFLEEEYDLMRSVALNIGNIVEKEMKELSLLHSELKYKNLIENINTIVFELNSAGEILYISKDVEKLGFSHNEMGFSQLAQIFGNENVKSENELIDLLKTFPSKQEIVYKNRDNKTFWLRVFVRFSRSDQHSGNVIGTLTDITEERENELKLHESEKLYTSIVKASPDSITITDLEGYIQYTSPLTYEMFGLSADYKLEGKHLFDFLVPEDRAKAQESIGEMFKKNFIGATEYRGIKGDGSVIYIEVNGDFILDDNGQFSKMVFVTRDLTGRKVAEQQIAQQETVFQELVESIKDVVYELDASGVVLYVSPAIFNVLGYEPEEMVGKNFLSFVYPEDVFKLKEAFTNLTKRDYPYMESRFIAKDGNLRWVRSSTNPLMKDGKMIGGRGTLHDVSDKKTADIARIQSEKKFRILFETMIQGVVYQNAEGYIFSANKAAEEILGLSLDQMLGRTSVHPEWRAMREDGSPFPGEDHPAMEALRTGKEVRNVIMGVYNPVKQAINWINVNAVPQFIEGHNKPYQVFTTFEDVTGKMLAEKQLKESEQKLRIIADNNFNWEFWEAPDGEFLYHSPSSEKLTGLPLEKLMQPGYLMNHVVHPDDVKAYKAHHHESQTAHKPGQHYFRIVNADGEIRYIEHFCQPVFDSEGKYLGVRGTNLDITERRKSEIALRESEARLQNLVNSQTNFVLRTDLEGRHTYWNDKFLEAFGHIYELTGMDQGNSLDSICDYHHQRTYDAVQKCMEHPEQAFKVELDKPSKDGGVRTTLWEFVCLTDIEGNPSEIQCVGIDITERVQAERALAESEEKYRLIAENTSDGILMLNANGDAVYASPAYLYQMGYKSQEEFDLKFENILGNIHPDGKDELLTKINQAVQEKQKYLTYSYQAKHQQGHYIWLEDKTHFTYDENGQMLQATIVSRDITERKRDTEKLAASEERLSRLVDSQTNYVLRTDMDGLHTYWNRKFEEDFGWIYTARGMEKADSLTSICEYHHERVKQVVEKCVLNPGEIVKVEIDKQAKDGGVVTTLWEFVCLTDSAGQPIEMQCMGLDITERRKAEIQLEQSERNYKNLFFNSPLGYLIIRDGVFIECNNTTEDIIGLKRDKILGKSPADISPEYQPNAKRSRDYAAEMLAKAYEQKRVSFEWTHLKGDGSTFIAQVDLSLITYEGKEAVFTTWQDITVKKKAEEQLRKLSKAVEQSPVSIVITDLDGNIEYANPQACTTTGYSLEELLGQNPRVLKSGETSLSDYNNLWSKISNGNSWSGVFHNKRKNGELYWESSNIVPILDEEGQPTHYMAIKEDITERKATQEALLYSEERFRQISEHSKTIIWEVNLNGKYTYISPVAEKVMGYTPDEMIGKMHFYDLLLPDIQEEYKIKGLELMKSGEPIFNMVFPMLKKDGSALFVVANGLPIHNAEGVVIGYRGSDNDITEQKLAEEELRKFQAAIEQASYGLAIADLQGNLLFVNETFAGMHGYTIEEVSSKHLSMLHTQAQLIKVNETIEKLQKYGSFSAEEVWRVRKDGTEFPSLMNATIIMDENQHPQFMSATAIDITELKTAEAALKDREQKLNEAQEIAKMGSWEMDMETQIVRYSKNYFNILEIEPGDWEMTNERFQQAVHPEDLPKLDKTMEELMETRAGKSMEIRLLMPDGRIKWVQNNVVPHFEGDKLVKLSGVNLDITEKKKREDQINEQNNRLSAILDAIPDMMFVSDGEGNYLEYFSSKSNSQLNDYSDLVGTNIKDAFDPETAEIHLEKIKECLETKKIVTYEYPRIEDGLTKYWEGRIVYMDRNKVLRFVREITDKKHAESEIKRLTMAIEQSPVAIVVTDLEANVQYVSPSFYKITGYTPQEAIGQNTRILKSGKTPVEVYEELWANLRAGKSWEGEWINKKKNGELYWESISITPIRNELGEIDSYLAIKEDISQRKKDEEEIRLLNQNLEKRIQERTAQLAETNQDLEKQIEVRKKIELELIEKSKELENFFSVSLDLLCIADTSGNFIKVNKAWETILGYPVEELEKRTFLEFVHPDDVDATLDKMKMLSEQKPILDFTNRYRNHSGDFLYIEWHGVPVGNYIYAAARDITDRIKAEDYLKKAKAEAENANKAKSEFLSRMSHELRTPLNSILGFAQLLEMADLKPQQKSGVGHIMRSGRHLLDLINEVLDISRIEAGKISLSVEPVELRQVLNEIMEIVQPLANRANISCMLKKDETFNSSIFIKADRQRLKQVLINLINNGIKYNKEFGQVEVSVKQIAGEQEDQDMIRVLVTDTGMGISEEDIPKLFTPFERIGAEKSETEGTGLGLTVVKKLIDLMGGKLGVESKLGEGSTFWFEMPVANGQSIELPEADETNDDQGETVYKGTLLYIEDNISNIELMEQIIENYRPGVKMITEVYGSRTTSLVLEWQPELIFLDLNLPDIHGSEVLEKLKADERVKHIPVIVISADAMPRQLEKLTKLGAEDYLTKPIDVAQVLRVIDSYLINKQ